MLAAASIGLPTTAYFAWARMQRSVLSVGRRTPMALHVWRIPAVQLFFGYFAKGLLPPLLWMLAGLGDLIAGSHVAWLLLEPESKRRHASFHRFGLADFVVAVGTGLAYTLLQDARMAALVALPKALIPLFGVGISGATHLMAFDLMRRDQDSIGLSRPIGGHAAGASRLPAATN